MQVEQVDAGRAVAFDIADEVKVHIGERRAFERVEFQSVGGLDGRGEDAGHVCDGHGVHAAASCSNNCSANTSPGTFAS